MRPHRRQPTRLLCPWDSPGKNTGVGCHFLLHCMKVKSESEVAQSWPTLSDPMDWSLPGSSIHGIFQARVLEWGAIAFSSPWSYVMPTLLVFRAHPCSPPKDTLQQLYPFSTISTSRSTESSHQCTTYCYFSHLKCLLLFSLPPTLPPHFSGPQAWLILMTIVTSIITATGVKEKATVSLSRKEYYWKKDLISRKSIVKMIFTNQL